MSLVIPLRHGLDRLPPYRPPVEGRLGKIRLDFNENTSGPLPAALGAVRRLSAERIASYPEVVQLEASLARFFRVRPEQLLATAGADDALRLLADAFIAPGVRVLIVEPTFALYRWYVERAGGRVIALRYGEEMEFPLDAVCRRLARRPPRLLFLANPNNPTGTLLARQTLERILAAASATLVVIDEAYADFAGVSMLGALGRPNLVVLRTFSKLAGLAGLRIGCLLAHPELIAALRRLRPPYTINVAAAAAAAAAIGDRRQWRRQAARVRRNRQRLMTALQQMGIRVYPSAANFVLADFGPQAPQLLAALARRGILLRDRAADFGRPGPVRITVGTASEIQALLQALRAWQRRAW